MKDRFSNATLELVDRNPFVCDSCHTTYGHATIGHLDNAGGDRDEDDMRGAECLYNCDPMPFGD